MSPGAVDGLTGMTPTPDTTIAVWPTVHAERRRLVDDLAGLSPDAWTTPSLCAGWDVHDVLAHLVHTAVSTRRRFLLEMVRCRFDFDRQNTLGVAAFRHADPSQTLDAMRGVLDRTDTPPAPLASRLHEVIVHGEDVRRPLGIRGEYPMPGILSALTMQVGGSPQFGGARDLVAGLRLAADDVDYVHGDGPEVTGPALSLLLAVSGRHVALDELSGAGLETLRSRG